MEKTLTRARRTALASLIVLVIVVAALRVDSAPPPGSGGGGVTIGCFCMDGVRGRRHDAEQRQTPEGTWTPWTYEYTKTPNSRQARLFVFDRAVPTETALLSCEEIAAKAQETGVRLLLAGTLNHLRLKGVVFQSTTGASSRFQVDAGKLDAELGRVISGALKVGGGSMELAGAKLWLTNPGRLLVLADKIEGTAEIEAWNRTIAGAIFRIPGGGTMVSNLTPVNPEEENVTTRLDLATGEATLWRARMQGRPGDPLKAPSLIAGGAALTDVEIAIRKVTVDATGGQVTAALRDASGKAAGAKLVRPTVTTELASPAVKWARATSLVRQSTAELALQELSLAEATFHSEMAEVRSSNGGVAIRGEAEAEMAALTSSTAKGRVRWTRPDIPALPFLLPQGAVRQVDLNIDGDLESPRMRGAASATQFAVGPVLIAHALSLAFDFAGGSNELRFPVRFSIGPVGASAVIRDLDQAVAITATLAKADLNGTAVVTWPDLGQSRLEVQPNQFRMRLVNTVATKPLLAGTAPSFGTAEVAAENLTALVAAEKSSGTLRLTSDILVLGQPILRVGPKGKESPTTLKLTANGSASAGYDLATGKMSLLKGSFLARDLDFALLDPAGSIDLSGTVISSPRLKLRELSIDVDQQQQPAVSRGGLKGLSIDAALMSRPRSPQRPNEVTFEGTPARPFTIEEVEALQTSISDAVDLQKITVRGLDFALRDAGAQFGEGFAVHRASLALKAKSIAHVAEGATDDYRFEDAAFAIDGRLSLSGQVSINSDTTFALDLNVSGTSEHLSGSGRASLGGFTGFAVTTLPIEGPCTINLPVEYNFASGGAEMAVRANDGRFDAEASLGPLALLLKTTSGASCDTPSEEHVISEEKEAWTTGVCCCPPKFCKWSVTIPKVAIKWHKRFEIHAMAATATLTNPRAVLRDGRLRVCNLGAIALVMPIPPVGGVSPQVETAFPGADAILNPIISGLFTVVETALAATIVNGAGLTVSSIATVGGNAMCLVN